LATITVTGFKDAQAALSLPDLKQALYDEGAALMDRVLVTLDGHEHRRRRLMEMKIFKKDFFAFYEQEVFPPVVRETLEPFVARGTADLVEVGYHCMIGLTADFAGIDRPLRTAVETADLVRLLRVFGIAATVGQFTGSREEAEDLKSKVAAGMRDFEQNYFDPSVARREALLRRWRAGEISEDQLPRDILTLLLKNEDQIDLPRDMVLRETAFYFLAGAHTSVHSLSHAMHEIFMLCRRDPAERAHLVADALFLQRCVHESFRLHPASPISKRRPLCPVQLPHGVGAGPEDTVVVDLYQANRQTEFFGADAREFNAYRAKTPPHMPYGLTFGVGVHSCLGKNLAAGELPRGGTDAATHQYGTVAKLAGELLKRGAEPDPSRPAQQDLTTERETWITYPIVFAAQRPSAPDHA
jgi:cytochrome P450